MDRRAPLLALYTADAISLVGNVVAQLAIPWYVLVTTGSATLTGLAVFLNFLLLGGVVIETVGVAATFLGIGLCYVAVTAFGFFNPAFHEMDRPSADSDKTPG